MSRMFRVRSMAADSGTIQDELLEFPDEAALLQALGAQRRIVLDVMRQPVRRARTGRQDFALFCRELETLVVAGMTVVEAVDTLAGTRSRAAGSRALAISLIARLEQGQSLSNALAALPGVPAVLVAAVKAGEHTSNLADALRDFLRFDDLVRRLEQKVLSASLYPALVTALGLGVTVFLLLVVLPNFARMYQGLRGTAAGATAWIVEASVVFSVHQLEMLAALALVGLVLGSWAAGGGPRILLQELTTRLPWLRDRMRDFRLAMLYQALALMLKGGYPLPESLQVAGRAALSPELREAAGRALAEIEHGQLPSAALFAHGLCDEVGRRLMAAAERNGDFDRVAATVSRLHGERFELFVDRATRIVEPLLLLAVALLVGTVVVMMYLPVFDMATRLR